MHGDYNRGLLPELYAFYGVNTNGISDELLFAEYNPTDYKKIFKENKAKEE